MKHIAWMLLLATCSAVAGADPVPKVEVKKPPIRFPEQAVKKTEVPVVNPAAPQALGKGQFYVIEADKPYIITQEGTGYVDIIERKGPLPLPTETVVGRTPDAADPYFVTFKGEYLYLVKAVKTGPVALTATPALNDLDDKGKQIPLTKNDITKKLLDADDGTGPRPPPVVIDPPNPKVDPKVDPKPVIAKGLRVMFVYDALAPLTKEQDNIMSSTKIVEYLNGHCTKGEDGRAEWRKWDSEIDKRDMLKFETDTWKKLWTSTKSQLGKLPQIVIVNDTTGKTYDLPATEAATLELLKQYGGP